MADFNNSTNMSLPIPTVGTAPGPTWATLLDSCLTILDSHSHVAGSGVPITPAALNINADLAMNSQNLTAARSVRFTPQTSPLALAPDLGCLYESGVDLYYNDGNGSQIRITQSGSVAGAAGTITGLPSGTASASYVAGTFVWQAATNTAANMDFGSAVMRNTSPNSTYSLTLSPPAALAVNYALTLPALPVSTRILSLTSSGIIATGATGAIVTADLGTAQVTAAKIESNVNLAGNAVQENGRNLVVSNTNAAVSLAIVRGSGAGVSTDVIAGEGFTIAFPTTGQYIITFTTPFADVPAVSVTSMYPGILAMASHNGITLPTASGFTVFLQSRSDGSPNNGPFSFIAIGQRA